MANTREEDGDRGRENRVGEDRTGRDDRIGQDRTGRDERIGQDERMGMADPQQAVRKGVLWQQRDRLFSRWKVQNRNRNRNRKKNNAFNK